MFKQIKRRPVFATIVAALVVATVFNLFSPDRDLEVALGMRKLPGSLADKHIWSHTFTDYQVSAFFRIAPEGLDELLSARPYEKQEGIPGLQMSVAQMFSNPMEKTFPAVRPFETAEFYKWSRSEPNVFCRIWVDASRSLVFVQYGAD